MDCYGPNQINKSYFLYNDTLTGWGVDYFFSFFVALNREKDGSRYVEASILGLFLVAGIIENGFICWGVLAFKKLRKTANLFIVNLAISTILYLINFSFIIDARLKGGWTTGEVTCKLTIYNILVTGVISLWTQMMIAIIRFRKISSHGMIRLRAKHVFFLCALTWIVNVGLLYPGYMYSQLVPTGFYYATEEPILMCTFGMPFSPNIRYSYLLFSYVLGLGYIVPLIVILATYGRILNTLSKSKLKSQVYVTSTGKTHIIMRRTCDQSYQSTGRGSTSGTASSVILPVNNDFKLSSETNPSAANANTDDSALRLGNKHPSSTHDQVRGTCRQSSNIDKGSTGKTFSRMFVSLCPAFTIDQRQENVEELFVNDGISMNQIESQSRSAHRVTAGSKNRTSAGSHTQSYAAEPKREDETGDPDVRIKKISTDRHRKSTHILIALVVTFFMSWISVFVVYTWQVLEEEFECYSVSSTAFVWTLVATLVNACTNPILYGFISHNFRIAMGEILKAKGSKVGQSFINSSIS